MKCPKCGSRLWKKEDKCPKCGEKLEAGALPEENKKTGLVLKLGKSEKNDKDDKADKPDKSDKSDKIKLKKDSGKPAEKSASDKDEDRKSKKDERGESGKRGLFGRKDKSVIEVKADKPEKREKPEPGERVISIKLILIAAAALLVVVLIFIIVVNYRSGKGERYAESAYEYIGKDIRALNDGMTGKVYYADSSQYAGVNNAVKFDHIAESEKSVRAGGVKYPAWAVTVKNDKNAGFISDITYTDFTVIKGDMRGIKTSGAINLDKFSEGEKQSSVLREIKPRPYSISCSQTGIILYTYKYWYKLDNGDEQAAILRVGFTEKGDFKYATTELLIPQYM